MTPAAVTGTLLHDLVTGSHAEGITALGVETVIEHNDAVLLVAEPGPDSMTPGNCPEAPCFPARLSPTPCTPPPRLLG